MEGDGVAPDVDEEAVDVLLADVDGVLQGLVLGLVEGCPADELGEPAEFQRPLQALVRVLTARQHEERVPDQRRGERQHVRHCTECE